MSANKGAMAYEKSSYHRKWWVKTIRERNYFGFRYWWFNWALLLCCMVGFALSFNSFRTDSDNTCLNRNNLTRRVDGINAALDMCCACKDSVLVNPLEPPEAPQIPKNTLPCNSQVVADKVLPGRSQERLVYLGNNPGRTTLHYDMFACCDFVKVEYGGRIIASSNCEFDEGTLQFNYAPINDNYTVKVIITGGSRMYDGSYCDGDTNWSFYIDCPN